MVTTIPADPTESDKMSTLELEAFKKKNSRNVWTFDRFVTQNRIWRDLKKNKMGQGAMKVGGVVRMRRQPFPFLVKFCVCVCVYRLNDDLKRFCWEKEKNKFNQRGQDARFCENVKRYAFCLGNKTKNVHPYLSNRKKKMRQSKQCRSDGLVMFFCFFSRRIVSEK